MLFRNCFGHSPPMVRSLRSGFSANWLSIRDFPFCYIGTSPAQRLCMNNMYFSKGHLEKILNSIDLVGYPGEYASMLDPDQINMLDRMGHPIFLLPYSEWHRNREKTIDRLHVFFFLHKRYCPNIPIRI